MNRTGLTQTKHGQFLGKEDDTNFSTLITIIFESRIMIMNAEKKIFFFSFNSYK